VGPFIKITFLHGHMLKIDLDLTREEVEMLKDALQGQISDLRMEIANTDRLAFRDQLKVRKEAIKKLFNALNT